jgi:hypothetical protein
MGRKKRDSESDEDYLDESSGYEEPVATKVLAIYTARGKEETR